MRTIKYETVDKSTWGPGPWQEEHCDKMQWQDDATGLPCLIVRNRVGSLCGYVGVSAGHPLYEKSYDEAGHLDVHGGLTFSDHCQSMDKARWEKWRASMIKRKGEAEQFPKGDMAIAWTEDGDLVDDYEAWAEDCEQTSICHAVEDGEDDQVWWLGFDCCHAGDFSPKMEAQMKDIIPGHKPWRDDTYKDLAYVQAECRSLCRQLKEIENASRGPERQRQSGEAG